MRQLRDQMAPSRARVAVAIPLLVAPWFFATGLFRLEFSDAAAVGVCLMVALLLALLPRVGVWAGLAWLFGCASFAGFLLWLFLTMGSIDG